MKEAFDFSQYLRVVFAAYLFDITFNLILLEVNNRLRSGMLIDIGKRTKLIFYELGL